MRIVILGASGLIGHKLLQNLSARFDNVVGTLHSDRKRYESTGIFTPDNSIENVDALDFDEVRGVLKARDPDVVLNCIGITKRRPEIQDMAYAIEVNALFPHRLANWAKENGKRIIHFSTDCVFDGELGDYNEKSDTTGRDTYGKTKALGEINYDHTLTIRSSFIGRELAHHSELLDWFLAQHDGPLKGFTDAWYSGISTIEMTRIVGDIIEHHPDIGGLHQLSTKEPISKFDLLLEAKRAFGRNIEINPDDNFSIRPTLNSTKLRKCIQIELPDWASMMATLAADKTVYPKL